MSSETSNWRLGANEVTQAAGLTHTAECISRERILNHRVDVESNGGETDC